MSDAMLKALEFFGVASLMGWIILFSGLRSVWDTHRREVPSGRTGHAVYWTPLVEFTAEGQKCRFEYAYSLDRAEHPVGETADVLYDMPIMLFPRCANRPLHSS